MRPLASTPVASTITKAAPPIAKEPKWTKCQSLTNPSSHEYVHIGATQIRFLRVTPRIFKGENKSDFEETSDELIIENDLKKCNLI
jgi:hypothetical protein